MFYKNLFTIAMNFTCILLCILYHVITLHADFYVLCQKWRIKDIQSNNQLYNKYLLNYTETKQEANRVQISWNWLHNERTSEIGCECVKALMPWYFRSQNEKTGICTRKGTNAILKAYIFATRQRFLIRWPLTCRDRHKQTTKLLLTGIRQNIT